MAINWKDIDRQSAEMKEGLGAYNSRTSSRALAPEASVYAPERVAPRVGADLAKFTLGNSMAENLAQRQVVMPPVRKEVEPPTVGERVGSGVSSIFTRLAATPFVLGEAIKSDFEAVSKAERGRGAQSSYFDVDPTAVGQKGNQTLFDIDPDKVEQNPNAGVEKYQKPLDPNSIGMKLMRQANEEQARATEGMSGAGKFLADTAISVGSNAVLLPLAAINPAIPMAAMGAQAAAGKTYELTEQGKNAGEALGRGIISGSIEAITEKLPIDTIADIVKVGGKGALRNVLKQAGVEAGEETVSYLANRLMDAAAGDVTARELFSMDTVRGAGESALGGAISGGLFGAGGTAVNRAVEGVKEYQALPKAPADGTAAGQQKTASAVEAVNENGLSSFTAQERANLSSGKKNKIVSTVQDAVGFIRNALADKQSSERAYLGKLPESTAQKVFAETGVDVHGYNAVMPSDAIRHMFKRHGDPIVETARGQVPLTPDMAAQIPSVLSAPDKVKLSDATDKRGRRVLIFEKTIGDYYITAQAISDGTHSLQTDTLYVQKMKDPLVATSDASVSADPAHNAQSVPPSGPSSDTTIPQAQQGVKEEYMQENRPVSPDSSVGAAPLGFDPYSHFLNQKSEFFPEGANAARPVDVPTTDLDGRNIRKTAATAMGAKAIPDEAVTEIQKMIMAGKLSYDVNSDKVSIQQAEKTLRDKGFDGALEYFTANVKKGLVSKDLATVGQQLLINAANAGDTDGLARVLSLYAQMETSAGQAVQAASILRKLPASSQLYAIKRVVSDLEGTISKKYGVEVKVSPELEAEFLGQTTQEGRDAVMEKIYDDIAAQVPSTWKDKWNAWRYLAMLGNPRTHVRNVAGNTLYQPLRITKDIVASGIEKAAAAAGIKLERTKTAVHNKALYEAALKDWPKVADSLLQGSKYNEATGHIEDRRQIFKMPVLETARKKNSELLEIEDAAFKKRTYADALAKYLEANGVTAEQFQTGNVDPALLSRARDYAGQEALKATFQDKNAVSDLVSRIGRYEGDDPAAKAMSTIVEGMLPFRRTPANILVRGVEYSPVGLAKSLTADLVRVRKGTMTAAQAIDNVAAGLTGSALFGLGAYLLSKGIVTPGKNEDEKQAGLDDLTGHQSYALELGDISVTLDWLAPEAIPFFMGVELANSVIENGWTGTGILSAMVAATKPMLEMSMLQSLNDMLESLSYADDKIWAAVSSALTSYVTQGVPTLLGQLERSAEDKRMTTYTDKTLPLATDAQYAIGRSSARLPGAEYQQIPYIDAWGREEEAESLPVRVFNNLGNPAYVSRINETAVDKEVQRLYDATGDGAVVPTRAPKYFSVGGERLDLSKDQYVTYAKERGQMAYQVIESLTKSKTYQALSDTDKAAAIDAAYDYANALAKEKVSEYKPDGWIKKARDGGIDPAVYILYRASADADGNGSVTQQEAEKAARMLPVADSQRAKLWQSQNSTWKAKNNPFR